MRSGEPRLLAGVGSWCPVGSPVRGPDRRRRRGEPSLPRLRGPTPARPVRPRPPSGRSPRGQCGSLEPGAQGRPDRRWPRRSCVKLPPSPRKPPPSLRESCPWPCPGPPDGEMRSSAPGPARCAPKLRPEAIALRSGGEVHSYGSDRSALPPPERDARPGQWLVELDPARGEPTWRGPPSSTAPPSKPWIGWLPHRGRSRRPPDGS